MRYNRLFLAAMALGLASPLSAQDAKPPFWGSVKASEVNMRVGPGEAYRIVWVYHRQQLPMKVLRTKEGWWLVQDPDGTKGWVLGSLMTQRRGVIVKGDGPADMREKGDASSKLKWRLEPGVTGRLGECADGWCELTLPAGHQGFVAQDRLWGAGEP